MRIPFGLQYMDNVSLTLTLREIITYIDATGRYNQNIP